MLGNLAVEKINSLPVKTILDVGCGGGQQARSFCNAKKKVTVIDLPTSHHVSEIETNAQAFPIKYICGNFMTHEFVKESFDCVFACHVLEHQRNVGMFLEKMINVTKNQGYVCVTVPPAKKQIVGGHLSCWNAGLLLYNLVLAGIDCSEAMVKSYGYNITVITRKNRIKLPENLSHDSGDIEKLAPFFPSGCRNQSFNGDIKQKNW